MGAKKWYSVGHIEFQQYRWTHLVKDCETKTASIGGTRKIYFNKELGKFTISTGSQGRGYPTFTHYIVDKYKLLKLVFEAKHIDINLKEVERFI